MALVIHTHDGERVGRDELAAVKLPKETKTYTPVPYVDLVDKVREVFDDQLGAEVAATAVEAFGLARKGAQMFGTVTYDLSPVSPQGPNSRGLVVGFRASHNKTLPVGVVSGVGVFVCDNLVFGGELRETRLHTKNVWDDLGRILREVAAKAVPEFERVDAECEAFRSVKVEDDDEAFALLGMARGRGVIPVRQFEIALRCWRGHWGHEAGVSDLYNSAFEGRNLWRLHNAMTEAAKSTPPRDVVQRHQQIHSFIREMAA